MAEEGRHRNHSCSPTVSTGTPIMATPLRKVCNRILGFATSCRKNTAPYGRRIFHREVEQDEFQYGNTHCLSSYYSVFVVRLAIMVCLISLSLYCCILYKFHYWIMKTSIKFIDQVSNLADRNVYNKYITYCCILGNERNIMHKIIERRQCLFNPDKESHDSGVKSYPYPR
jgi:hypothetical protein